MRKIGKLPLLLFFAILGATLSGSYLLSQDTSTIITAESGDLLEFALFSVLIFAIIMAAYRLLLKVLISYWFLHCRQSHRY